MPVAIVALAVSSFFTARYLSFPPEELFAILVLALSLVAARSVWVAAGCQWRGVRRLLVAREVIGIGLFACLLDASLVLGYHIVTDVTGLVKFGLSTEVYISPYSWVDAVALAAMLPSIFAIFFGLFCWIKGVSRGSRGGCKSRGVCGLRVACGSCGDCEADATGEATQTARPQPNAPAARQLDLQPIGIKPMLVVTAVVFAAWLPYLIVYFPGFVFNDSLDSVRQCLGIDAYNNHHPFLYTMLLDGCLWLGRTLGIGNTGGCAIYCVGQMLVMAYVVAYLSLWVVRRAGIRQRWGWAIAAVFALSPYVATFSIALWKDPLFTVAMVVLTLLLADLVLSRGELARQRRWYLPVLALALLAVAFLRNNGVYIVVAVGVVLAIMALSCWRRHDRSRPLGFAAAAAATAFVTVVYAIVCGPIYQLVGVAGTESVEVVGMQLNQMARVVVMDGDMTDENRAYMASLMPLDEYASVYTPATVDNLKWAEGFNAEAVKVNGEFVRNWLTMMINNPRTCFEAWELQTFGFWALNQSDITATFKNIGNGWPIFPGSERIGLVDEVGIDVSGGLGMSHGILQGLFTHEPQSIPLSFVFWGVLYLAICMLLLGRASWLVPLVPTIVLVATLFVASPMWYWPRYAATLHFLIPFYWLAFHLLAHRSSLPPSHR